MFIPINQFPISLPLDSPKQHNHKPYLNQDVRLQVVVSKLETTPNSAKAFGL